MCHINAKLRELRQDFGVSAVLMFDPFLTVFMKFCAISNMMQMNTSRILDLKLSIYSLSLYLSLSLSLSLSRYVYCGLESVQQPSWLYSVKGSWFS